jgi:hypothetical protein
MSTYTDKQLGEMFTHILDALDMIHVKNDSLESDIRVIQKQTGQTPNKKTPIHKKETLQDIWRSHPKTPIGKSTPKSPPKPSPSRKKPHDPTNTPSRYDDTAGIDDDLDTGSIALNSSEYDIGQDGRAASKISRRRHRTRRGKKGKKGKKAKKDKST